MRTDDIDNGENMGEWSPSTGGGIKKTMYTGKTMMGKAPASRRLQKLQFGSVSDGSTTNRIFINYSSSTNVVKFQSSHLAGRRGPSTSGLRYNFLQ